MPRTDHDRVIALAGLLLATSLVRDIARRGQANPEDVETCLSSLLKIDAVSSDDVYGGGARLKTGLRSLDEHLRQPRDMEITRYVLAVWVLERKLARQAPLLNQIRKGIEAIKDKLDYFPVTHDNIVAGLAEIYSSTISKMTPRILVNGDYVHLTNPDNANRIRALLLAAIRAATLWRQSGGGRLTLLFRRKALLLEIQRTLDLTSA